MRFFKGKDIEETSEATSLKSINNFNHPQIRTIEDDIYKLLSNHLTFFTANGLASTSKQWNKTIWDSKQLFKADFVYNMDYATPHLTMIPKLFTDTYQGTYGEIKYKVGQNYNKFRLINKACNIEHEIDENYNNYTRLSGLKDPKNCLLASCFTTISFGTCSSFLLYEYPVGSLRQIAGGLLGLSITSSMFTVFSAGRLVYKCLERVSNEVEHMQVVKELEEINQKPKPLRIQ